MHGANNDAVTLGEVYRLVRDMDDRHGAQLQKIEQQVTITNGRTTRLETRVEGHDRELRDLKRQHAPASVPSEVADLVAVLKQTANDDGKPALTRRDLKVLGSAFLAVQTVIGWLMWIWLNAPKG